MNAIIVLSIAGLLTLFTEIFSIKKATGLIAVAGLIAAIVTSVLDWNIQATYYNGMVSINNFSTAISIVILGTVLLWILLAHQYLSNISTKVDYYALVLFATVGALMMVSFGNMIVLFIGIEILSLAMYVLAGSNKKNLSGNEAAFKYFLLGAFASGFLLFGIALLYGATQSFNLEEITTVFSNGSANKLALAGMLMVFTAMCFKVGAAPFHFWTPDVYQGSPTMVTALMSTLVKTAAFAAFYQLFKGAFTSFNPHFQQTLWIIIATTILAGNIMAAYQTSVKRMLAYSSIAHAGYMLLSLTALPNSSSQGLLFYSISYNIASIGAFCILNYVITLKGNDHVDAFKGLGYKQPLLAFATIITMLSLAGIPPLAGFFGKYLLISESINAGNIALSLIAIVGSLIGVFYYFRPIIGILDPTPTESARLTFQQKSILVLIGMAALTLGLMPNLLTNFKI